MFTIVEHLARRSQRTTRRRTRTAGRGAARTFLVVDEGWKMLERRSTGRWINEQARRSRHNRLFLVAISQSLIDFTTPPRGARRSSRNPRSSCCSNQLDGQRRRDPAGARADRRGGRRRSASLTHPQGRARRGVPVQRPPRPRADRDPRRRRRILDRHLEPDHDQPLRRQVLAQVGGDPWAAVRSSPTHHRPRSAAMSAAKPLIGARGRAAAASR